MRVMSRVGPAELTLAEIGREAGVTPSALVQRFGSKRRLLATMTAGLGQDMRQFFDDLRAKHDDPLHAVRAYACCMADMAATPADLLRNVAYLQADIADEESHHGLVARSKLINRELVSLLQDSVARGDLRRETDAVALARNIEALISGALLTWAVHRRGTARAWLRRHIDALIEPHRA
jgi:AcrR family transcriptional regulator